MKQDVHEQLKSAVELLKVVLGDALLAVYLYGSSVVGGLQKYSDIDLLIVTSRSTTSEEKSRLVSKLLEISGLYMKDSKRPMEITIVEQCAINPWNYPPRCDFQYGEWLRESFESGIIDPWIAEEMPDLAIIITQVLLRSETLYGLKPESLLDTVPYSDFMNAMLQDLNRLSADLESDTRNVLLTLARIWSTVETSSMMSKPSAADWVIDKLPEIYHTVMKRAKSICIGNELEYWGDIAGLIKPCADFMLEQIKEQSLLLDLNDSKKLITLA